MITLSLLGVLLLARVAALLGHAVPLSWWSPAAFLWQDVLVVLLFAGWEWLTRRRPAWTWTAYGLMAVYAALNVPLLRLLSSPLTVPMLRATRGALADSIFHQLTGETMAIILGLTAAAVLLPFLLRGIKLRPWPRAGLIAAGCLLVALGPPAARRVDTNGLNRNPVVALLDTSRPRLESRPGAVQDWRQSPISIPASIRKESGGANLSRFQSLARGRHVLLILLESAGAEYLKPYGADEDPMPNLTALAGESILFEHAYSVYPESIKGLLSILCSRYPAFDTSAESCARLRTPALAGRLARAGYRTALFHSGRFMYLGMESVVKGRGFQTLEDAGDIGGNHESSFGVEDEATVDRMLGWIDSLSPGEKFFVTYVPVAGHHPYSTPGPRPYPERTELDRYRNALHYGDSVLGKLFDGLKARHLYEHSLIIVLGDHGEAFGQHEGNYGHTMFLYEENLHVPFLIAAPGLIREPVRLARVASLIDTAPTVLNLLGLPIPPEFQGRSLLVEKRECLALFDTDYSLGLLGLRDGRWKFIYELETGRAKLFDLKSDPDEATNLAGANARRVTVYRDHLRQWAEAQRSLTLQPLSGGAWKKAWAGQKRLGRRGRLAGFLRAGLLRLRLAWERFPFFSGVSFSHSAERRRNSALWGPCAATMCSWRPNGTFCLQIGQFTMFAMTERCIHKRLSGPQPDGFRPFSQA
jgi:Sulfatase